jgi:hypothetical protein
MRTSPSLESDVTYIRCLTKAVLDGVTSGLKGTAFTPVLTGAAWTPAAIGAAIGVLSASLSGRRKSGYKVALGGLVGSALGFGAFAAWTSRDFTGAVARGTIEKVNGVRDARWLEKNPIAYA